MLRSLPLPAIAANFEELALKAANASLTHEAFLYELVRAECLTEAAGPTVCACWLLAAHMNP